MSSLALHSCLAPQIHRFIRLRQLSGTDYHSQAQLLGYFDRFLVEQGVNEPRMTAPITERYLETLSHLTPRSQYNRFSVVRQLCQYLSRSDPLVYVPEPIKSIASRAAHPPYIYPPSEIQALLAAASELPPTSSLRPHTYRILLGLLYSTGVRISEAMALNLEDFHRAESCLYIAQGKFRKARWVPLSTSTARALQQYVHRRRETPPRSPDAPLLLNQRARRLHPCTINETFRRLLRQAGIPHHPNTGPRIHDLRHTFAVHRLLAWYRDGEDVNARLPWLATYMGHVDIHSTQVYLRATPQLIEEVDRRFHHYYLCRVQPQGENP